MKAITLHQPWASLVALGVKTVETRSWATKYRGPLAIHAGRARPPLMHLPPLTRGRSEADRARDRQTWLVIDTITDPAFQGPQPQGKRIPKRAQTPTLFYPHEGPHGRPWDRDAGTSSIEQDTAVLLPLGGVVATCTLVDCVPTTALYWTEIPNSGWSFQGAGGRLTRDDALRMLPLVVNVDQRPFGDFTEGRYAWLLADVVAIDPAPARGRQQLWEWAS